MLIAVIITGSIFITSLYFAVLLYVVRIIIKKLVNKTSNYVDNISYSNTPIIKSFINEKIRIFKNKTTEEIKQLEKESEKVKTIFFVVLALMATSLLVFIILCLFY